MGSSGHNSYVSNLISEITEAAKDLPSDPFENDPARKKLLAVAQKLVGALEAPIDTIRKMNHQPQSLAICRTAIKGGWFKALADGDNQKTATDAVEYYGYENLRALAGLPDFLVQNNYKVPSDPSNIPFVDAWGKGVFDYLKDNSARGSNFNIFMEGQQAGKRNWLDIYPVQDRLAPGLEEDENAVLLVDIGGGVGHDLRDFGNKRGSMPGRLVLQDLPAVILEVDSSKKPEIEAMPYDYYTPQPIKGARVYYFRTVLHSWNDEICQKILRNQMSAMKKGYSRLLINERVLHDFGVSLSPAASDVLMLVTCGGIQRTETEWRRLLDSVGLNIVGIWVMEEGGESIIEADFRDY